MGIYIPNMEKPKSCFECLAYDGEFMECRATGECVNETFYDKVLPDCPIIEIDEKAFNEVIKGYLEGLKAIQYGERRSDEHNT